VESCVQNGPEKYHESRRSGEAPENCEGLTAFWLLYNAKSSYNILVFFFVVGRTCDDMLTLFVIKHYLVAFLNSSCRCKCLASVSGQLLLV